jgi:glycine hydroxymethyltransferase
MTDFLFRGSLADLDPEAFELTEIEAERQARKLILIPSESQAPAAVRQALSSVFQNIYAEGYPDEETRCLSEAEILDYPARLGHFRRYSDPRYYKGVEYADVAEMLARRRCAQLFAANGVAAEDIFVNVQALSGAPANNAVYHALANPGDTILGMNLLHGGHLSHGSPANRSGKYYHAVQYTVDAINEQINYDQIEQLACQYKPRFIIAGYSSYPWSVDWARFHDIARLSGALLFADISHVAGLVAAGVYPSPLGYADVITFTTHKSLCGPRGACILTLDPRLARKIDRAVFPGEQGGPHVNVFVAMATAFKLAQTRQFRDLQKQVVKNCATFSERLKEHGFRIPYGGTNTHLMNLDCRSVHGIDGATLSGDQAARLLDLAGIVVNRNTIPGDRSALDPSGLRMGTPWVTQRGLKEKDMVTLADIISDLLKATTPFLQYGHKGNLRRARVDFTALEGARLQVRELADKAGIDFEPADHGYPHFYYVDDRMQRAMPLFELSGERVRAFLNFVVSSDVEALLPGGSQPTRIYTPQGAVDANLTCVDIFRFQLEVPAARAGLLAAWLRDLSDGFVVFDDDPLRKLPGPVMVAPVDNRLAGQPQGSPLANCKPYFVGVSSQKGEPLPKFDWQAPQREPHRTPLYETHVQLGAHMTTFAGWEMPVWYTSVLEEHQAVRKTAGLFDVGHMGVFQAEGPDAAVFLDCVVGNDIGALRVGESCYTHLLTPEAEVIDDLLVYRRAAEKYLLVVNASNEDKDWAWLNAVREGRVLISHEHPCTRAYGRGVLLRNLRDPKEGAEMRIDLALQGPVSRDILLALGADGHTRNRILSLKRTQLCEAMIGGFDLVISRTGYTGEKMGFELFIHPDQAAGLFKALLEAGEPFGLKPVGLGGRDSLRTEAGLPLYGHEMGCGSGRLQGCDLGVGEAGFAGYIKTYKPWFIGRDCYLQHEKECSAGVVRFRFNEKGVRMAHPGDPALDHRGKVIGYVTSCAVDSEGYLTGQAMIESKCAAPGTLIYIYQSASDNPGKPPSLLRPGERSLLPGQATVVSRFLNMV